MSVPGDKCQADILQGPCHDVSRSSYGHHSSTIGTPVRKWNASVYTDNYAEAALQLTVQCKLTLPTFAVSNFAFSNTKMTPCEVDATASSSACEDGAVRPPTILAVQRGPEIEVPLDQCRPGTASTDE